MTLSGPRLNLAGPYTLAIDVEGACQGTAPLFAELQHRRYDAILTQNGSTVTVALVEPASDSMASAAATGSAAASLTEVPPFTLGSYNSDFYYYGPSSYPNLRERLANGSILVVDGSVTTTGSATGLSGVMTGQLVNYGSGFPGANFWERADPCHRFGSR